MAQSSPKQYLLIEKMENDDILIKARLNKKIIFLIIAAMISSLYTTSSFSSIIQKIITSIIGA